MTKEVGLTPSSAAPATTSAWRRTVLSGAATAIDYENPTCETCRRPCYEVLDGDNSGYEARSDLRIEEVLGRNKPPRCKIVRQRFYCLACAKTAPPAREERVFVADAEMAESLSPIYERHGLGPVFTGDEIPRR